MKTKIIFLALVLILISSCGQKVYKRPEIGMKYQDFVALCGQPIEGVERKMDKSGSALIVEMKEDKKSEEAQCFGVFTFENGSLSKIDR